MLRIVDRGTYVQKRLQVARKEAVGRERADLPRRLSPTRVQGVCWVLGGTSTLA